MIKVWRSSLLGEKGIHSFFTMRLGGVSSPPYESLNLGMTTGDTPGKVQENRRIVEKEEGIKLSALAWQVHGDRVLALKQGTPIPKEPDLPKADAIVSDISGLSLAIFFADCVPVYLWDIRKRAGGLIHAGWRSTLREVVCRAIESMEENFNSKPADLIAAIGPSIGPCCFEVKSDVWEPFQSKFGKKVLAQKEERIYVDLWEANFQILLKKGVDAQRIDRANLCTSCSADLFFSHRRDKGKTGRMAGVLQLPDKNY
ncbi:MAG: peptidoglycan editing factor PgeF [Firmicutes bacterium]|nr:peptidoglycan editing factor PgeF [Bacillota bacterium]